MELMGVGKEDYESCSGLQKWVEDMLTGSEILLPLNCF